MAKRVDVLLASLEGKLVLSLARSTFQPQNNLLGLSGRNRIGSVVRSNTKVAVWHRTSLRVEREWVVGS